jgi:hypothetical protein
VNVNVNVNLNVNVNVNVNVTMNVNPKKWLQSNSTDANYYENGTLTIRQAVKLHTHI